MSFYPPSVGVDFVHVLQNFLKHFKITQRENMCRISRHTTLLLSGIAGLECRMVEMAKQGTGSLFTGAEKFPSLA
jgi:hypothetical protein